MAKVLLLGGSGLIGRELLRLLQLDPRVSRIVAPSRRPLPPGNKLINPLGANLTSLVVALDEPIDLLFCCLGTTRKEAGSAEAFRAVDYDLVVDCAKAAKELGARHCLAVSANGADAHSRFLYNRTKGDMEQALMHQGWTLLTLVRPSLLVGKRHPPRLLEQLSAPLFKLLPGKWKAIDSDVVAKALQEQAFNAGLGGVTVLESDQIAASIEEL
ncbi:hypothetical protein GW579_09815 [Rahnella sp. Lac-M11]|uniref:Semialdehyde dehydrogenase NAD-binding domain-containing protein n=1 Tax=Rahnella contaminans TaxID=2703882 RepID=A0A6M2B529_9GAMM|nr:MULTISPECIES: hypothetical protein [Rahnella]KAB8309808.1 hypothetical protein EH227_09210 [Rouxiella chamberiensis]MCS3424119.1 uncharacterized protein YbjT (DUF2867 family) [Rahnella sp. BIGb0603]NGX87377.1 hypothetical protein [Rahnella contaminans]